MSRVICCSDLAARGESILVEANDNAGNILSGRLDFCRSSPLNLDVQFGKCGEKFRDCEGLYLAAIDPAACDHAGACARACHFGARAMVTENGSVRLQYQPARCFGCGLCATVCPNHAITMTVRGISLRNPGDVLLNPDRL